MTSILRVCRGLAGVAIACTATLFATSLSATTVTCGERGAAYRLVSGSDGVYEIAIGTQDLITWRAVSGKNSVRIDIGEGYQKAHAEGAYQRQGDADTFRIRTKGKNSRIMVACNPGAGGPQAAGDTHLSGDSQIGATGAGLGIGVAARFGPVENIVSKNRVFVSSANMGATRFGAPDWNVWATLEGRGYSGGLDGTSFDVIAGVDRLAAPGFLIGALAGLNRAEIADSGVAESARAPMLGGYAAVRLGNALFLEGFASYATPFYKISGAGFSAGRRSVGMTLSGQFQRGKAVIEPFVFARQYSENQPSYTTSAGVVIAANQARSIAASLGVKLRLIDEGAAALSPYVSAAADYRRITTTLAGTDTVFAPRLGFGLSGTLGSGKISVDFDIGKARSDTYDRGVKMGYEVKF